MNQIATKKPKQYVNNADFLKALIEYKAKKQDCLKKNLPEPKIPNYIGECWMKKKIPEKALPFYKEALKIDPDFVSAKKRIAEIKP